MNNVVVRRSVEENDALSTLPPLLQRVYAARNIEKLEDIDRELTGLLPYDQLSQIDAAVQRLHQAMRAQEKILIIGDFDADGATASALAVLALKAFGANFVDYLVPNRFTYGYGLTSPIVELAKEREADLIITVDNGISSVEGVARANELGIDVIVTDHHLPGDELPNACVIVNPNQPGDKFPSKCIAGCGVIFYVMLALRAYLNDKKWFKENNIASPNMAQYLDLVALGTISDVVHLDKNNRIMVYHGLRRIRAGQARPGINALLEVSRRDSTLIKAMDLGFSIGPRLNAAGRLADMSMGITCLLSESSNEAFALARELDQLNQERRTIETNMRREAFAIVDQLHLMDQLPLGLCLYDENWHQGVVGLIASRVKEKLHRPVIAFATGEDGATLKGSARSIKGLHIRDILDNIATSYPDLLQKFGGHAMAAGLSISVENFTAFSKAFAEEVSKHLEKNNLQGQIETDGELSAEEFTLEVAELIRNAGPWGQGFPEPSFDGVFRLLSQRLIGQRHLKMVLQVPGTDFYVDGICFNVDTDEWPALRTEMIKIVYRLDVNEYRGVKKLQLLVEHLEALD